MALFQSFDISASGMTAQRFRMDTISENVANVNTTSTENGTPYRRKIVTFSDPSNPDADENGYVSYPNVNIVTEMTNLIDASRAYEANVTAFDASKQIAQAGLQIGKS